MTDDEERLKNLVLFKFYGTDKEMEEAAPFSFAVLAVIIVGGVLYALFK
jgi:hypothetical protein